MLRHEHGQHLNAAMTAQLLFDHSTQSKEDAWPTFPIYYSSHLPDV